MQIISVASFLIYPGKGESNPREVSAAQVPHSGMLFEKLRKVFERADVECILPIRFSPAGDGSKSNPVRGQIIQYIQGPTIERGRNLARRLRDQTTKKPGLGLLFIMLGKENNRSKLVLSRFPADEGIVAQENKNDLKIDYIERIFMKNAGTYKAAKYEDTSLKAGFWDGNVVDRQLEDPANYWIKGFLESEFKTTSKAGTKRLAKALRDATASVAPLEVKQEIVAATILARGQFNHPVSIQGFMDALHLSKEAQATIRGKLQNEAAKDETFILNAEEFLATATLASIELNTGAILTAPSDRFDETISREEINRATREYRFTTTGRIVDEKLKGKR